MTGRSPPNDQGCSLLPFPLCLGVLRLINPLLVSDVQFKTSVAVTNPLVSLLISCNSCMVIMDSQHSAKAKLCSFNHQQQLDHLHKFQESAPSALSRSIDIARDPGASTWLSALPLRDHQFHLHKGDFRDSFCLRYGWMPALLPASCVCGVSFTAEHALSCPWGGFLFVHHNEIRDCIAHLLKGICHDVCVEPGLQFLTGENLSYRSAVVDDGAHDFWGYFTPACLL